MSFARTYLLAAPIHLAAAIQLLITPGAAVAVVPKAASEGHVQVDFLPTGKMAASKNEVRSTLRTEQMMRSETDNQAGAEPIIGPPIAMEALEVKSKLASEPAAKAKTATEELAKAAADAEDKATAAKEAAIVSQRQASAIASANAIADQVAKAATSSTTVVPKDTPAAAVISTIAENAKKNAVSTGSIAAGSAPVTKDGTAPATATLAPLVTTVTSEHTEATATEKPIVTVETSRTVSSNGPTADQVKAQPGAPIQPALPALTPAPPAPAPAQGVKAPEPPAKVAAAAATTTPAAKAPPAATPKSPAPAAAVPSAPAVAATGIAAAASGGNSTATDLNLTVQKRASVSSVLFFGFSLTFALFSLGFLACLLQGKSEKQQSAEPSSPGLRSSRAGGSGAAENKHRFGSPETRAEDNCW